MAAKLLNSPDITSKKVFFFHFFSLFLVLRQFLCVFTMWAHAFDDVFRLFHLKTVGQFDKRNLIVFKGICLSAFHACEMDVVDMSAIAATAHAILLLTAAVIYLVQQVMLGKKPKSTEDARPVHVGHPLLHVAEGKCLLLPRSLFPNEYPHCRGFHPVFCQMIFYSVHFRHYSFF